MVTELTKEQLAMLPVIRDEFIARGLSTKQYAEVTPELRAKFDLLYKYGGLEPARDIYLVDSPLAVANKYKELTGEDTFDTSDFMYGSQDAGWISYYETFRRYVPEVKGLEQLAGLESLVGEVSYFAPYETCIIASRNPLEIHMLEGRLHKIDGPAIRYADGFSCYSLFGVAVDEDIIELVKAKDAKGILKLKNVEQRLVAMRAVGAEALLKQLDGRTIDKYEHWFAEGTLRAPFKEAILTGMGFTKEQAAEPEYVLYEVYLDGSSERILQMRNTSEPKVHFEWVAPDCNTVEQAMRMRMPLCVMEDGSFKWPGAKA